MVDIEHTSRPGAADLVGVATLMSGFWAEVVPGERPTLPAELETELVHPSPVVHTWYLVARDLVQVVGMARYYVELLDGYDHVAWLDHLVVAPDHRRSGIGRALVSALVEHCRDQGLTVVSATVPRDLPGTSEFAVAVGAAPELVQCQNRVRVVDLDRGQLEGWVSRAADRADAYSLVAFDDDCPEELLPDLARVVEVMNGAPHSAAVGEFSITADQVRHHRDTMRSRGHTTWTLCARHDPSGALVGYTELSFDPHRPWMAIQGDTGVDPAHRDHGLGRWLKAVNALRLLDERPAVEFIETWNADVNAPMLSINDAMGFRRTATWQEWELAV